MLVHKTTRTQYLRKYRMSSLQRYCDEDKFLQIEKEILKDTNARGDLKKLAKPGDLEKIVSHLRSIKNSSDPGKCLLLTGFPCIETSKVVKNIASNSESKETRNVQETDGIAGVIAIARALGPNKCIIGVEGDDNAECQNFEDSASFAVKRALDDLGEETTSFLPNKVTNQHNKFQIFSIPTVRKLRAQKQEIFFKQEILDKLGEYSVLAIEKAGYSISDNKDENDTISTNFNEGCKSFTMKARDITLDCAPADFMKCLWDNATLRMAIGDGGNELGLGAVNNLTCQFIPQGTQIACMSEFSADLLLISGVSNWGGYAIGLGILSMGEEKFHPKQRDMISEDSERVVAKTLRNLGVCDGVTGKFEHSTVDGISFDKHMILLQKLREILLLST